MTNVLRKIDKLPRDEQITVLTQINDLLLDVLCEHLFNATTPAETPDTMLTDVMAEVDQVLGSGEAVN